jgi:hypothetical protein
MPLMGEDIGKYRLRTITELIDEFRRNPRLVNTFSWVAVSPKAGNLAAGTLKLTAQEKRKVDAVKITLRPYVDMFVTNSRNRNVLITRLSKEDLDLLATAVVFNAAIATDERALQLIIRDLMEDPDEYQIEVINSIEVLKLLEMNSRLTPDERRTTIDSWIRLGERLHMNWRADYERNFGESYD